MSITSSSALEFLSAPRFTRGPNVPLAGWLQVQTDEPTSVGVSVDDGHGVWERRFYEYHTEHQIPLFGFKPGRTNLIAVTIYDGNQNALTASQPARFVTAPLPTNFPRMTLRASEPERMEPGYTLFRLDVQFVQHVWAVIVDHHGEVVWYHPTPSSADIRQLPNGNLFMPTATNFVEMNLLGEIVNTWKPPANLPIDPHDGVLTEQGTILYLAHATNSVPDYPTSVTNPNASTARAQVYFQKLVELDAETSDLLNVWDPMAVMDPYRFSYLGGKISRGWDSHHSNAIIEDPRDGGLVVSMRHQHAVIKFARDTGEIVWILGPHENWEPEWQPYLLTPVGTPFEWQYAQHAPVPTSRGTWMIYDNGNDRAMPFDTRLADTNNYTRVVEYAIDEETMEVTQVWEYGKNAAERLYTPFKGNAAPLPQTGNVLIGFSAVTHTNSIRVATNETITTVVRIQEVTYEVEPDVVFDLEFSTHDKPNSDYTSTTIYRALRIPDLYAVPAAALVDLAVNESEGVVELQIAADPAKIHQIEASMDLVNWEVIGEPFAEGENPASFHFTDELQGEMAARYYRVVSEEPSHSLD